MRKLSLALVLTMIFSMLANFNVNVAGAQALTVLTVSLDAVAGETNTVSVNIRNTSNDDISNFQIYPTSDGMDAVTASAPDSIAAGGDASVSINVFPARSDVQSVKSLRLTLSYTQNGVVSSQTGSVVVNVFPSTAPATPTPTPMPDTVWAPKLTVVSPSTYVNATAGRTVSVDVTLKNTGNSGANHIKLSAPVSSNFVLSVPNNMQPFSLGINGSKTFSVNITPDKSLKNDNYEVSFDYTYEMDNKTIADGKFTIILKVEKVSEGNANVILADFNIPETITAGDNFTLNMSAKNAGTKNAKAVQLYIDNLETDKFTAVNSPNNALAGDLKAGASAGLAFTINAGSKMKSGSYPLKFTVKYLDDDDKEVTDSFTYWITVASKGGVDDDKRALLQITEITRPEKAYAVNEDAVIDVVITNIGETAAKEISIKASPEDGLVPKTANTQLIHSLEAGESRTVSFAVAPVASAKSQSYTVGFTVDYQTGALDDNDAPKTDQFRQFVGINVTNPDADKDETTSKSVPKIIISDYKIDPLIVQAGQEFDIDLTFLNTHGTKTVSNITVSLTYIASETDKGNVFTPVGSSNIFYIDEIQPRGTSDQHIRMYTVPDAKAKNYIITANFDYEDEDGAKLTSSAEFGINVQQVTKIEMGDIFFPSSLNVGQEQYLDFSVQNTGLTTLRNLKVKVEGEGIDNSMSEQIFGNFPAGSYNYYNGSFTPITAGPTTIRIVVSYDNDMGERCEVVSEYESNINEAFNPEMQGGQFPGGMGMMPEMQLDKNGNPIDPNAPQGFAALLKNVWFWAGVGAVLAVIVVVTVVVVRKKKQRKGLDFDE